MSAPATPWFAEWFDHDYLKVYGHRDARDAERGVRLLEQALAPQAGARILDLACGPGRHAVHLAESGYRPVGLDLSQVLLREAQQVGAGRFPLVRADMRRLPFRDGSFAHVASFFTSFGYFEDDENFQVLTEIRRVLVAGGTLLLDYANRDQVLATLAPEGSRRLGSIFVLEMRSYDPSTQRLTKEIEIQDGSDTRKRVESVRLYGAEELLALLAAAGLEPEARFGDLDGSAFDPQRSPRLVVVARCGPRGAGQPEPERS